MTAACQARALLLDAANGSPDALASLVQSTILNDRELGLPINIVLERAEVLARQASMHGRDKDATVLAMILLASADHQTDASLADRRRAEAVAHVEIQAAGNGPTAEHAASLLNTLADQLPASVFSLARAMLGDVDAMLDERDNATSAQVEPMNDWPAYLEWRAAFGEVMDQRMHSLEWLDRQIQDETFRFTSAPDAALVTALETYPAGQADLHFMVAAGNLATLIDVLRPEAEEWAKSKGAIGAVVDSREGWARALKSKGYGLFKTAVRKDL